MTAAQLAKQLRAARWVTFGQVSEPNDVVDGRIVLSDGLHVQVGADYFNLVLETPQKRLRFFPARCTFTALLGDLEDLKHG